MNKVYSLFSTRPNRDTACHARCLQQCAGKKKANRKIIVQILFPLVACFLMLFISSNISWADEPAPVAKTNKESVTFFDIPPYQNILETKQLDTHGIKGTITQYSTRDLMRDVVEFYTAALDRDDYRIISNGWIEFVFAGEELPYTFESPNYSEPEGKKTTQTKYYPVVWQSLVIRIDYQTGNTDIIVNDLDKDGTIDFWRKQREFEMNMIKAGPRQIVLPPDGNKK